MRLVFAFVLFASLCLAEKLYVYSELTRIDPFGQIVAIDRGKTPPRHILSPGIPRNATSSLRLVVELDKPGAYHLDIAQNPDNAVRPMLYREVFEKHGEEWIPDRLVPVTIPYNGKAEDFAIPAQKVVTFWLDMTVKKDALVDRIKVEPQLWTPTSNDWVIYPMEVRILDATAPDAKPYSATVPGITEPADASLRGPLKQMICDVKETVTPLQSTARHMVHRNAVQHLSIATKEEILAILQKSPGAPVICEGPMKSPSGPEWYLRFRDSLFRSKSRVMP